MPDRPTRSPRNADDSASSRARSVPVILDGSALAIEDVVRVARYAERVQLDERVKSSMADSRRAVEACLTDGEAHYGVNTGFGSLSKTRVDDSDLVDLQRNLVRSHAAGVGEPLPDEVVRAMMLLLAGSLARGKSGVRYELVVALVGMLNQHITPVVPGVGSVGASGDLAPLAAIALALIGEGDVLAGGTRQPAEQALNSCGLRPLTLQAKEGLALINGTHLMAGMGALLVRDVSVLMHAAFRGAAMSIDASRGSHAFLDPRVHSARNQPSQSSAADEIRKLLWESQIVESHKLNDPRVQDPYCLRCSPQVLGASLECVSYVKRAIDQELGAVTDNPLVFASEHTDSPAAIVSAGNFHGMPLAVPLDCLTIAIAQIAGISERRTFWMLSAFDPESHLPPYLARGPRGAGLSSGLMIAQYTAAACCNEIITLATPASVSNIGTSAGIEDYNSFGPRAAMKARRAIELARYVVAIELLTAAEGLEYHRPLKSGEGVERAHAVVRGLVPRLTDDRSPSPDIEVIAKAIADGKFMKS
jgi:histidine ammonia-lyase